MGYLLPNGILDRAAKLFNKTEEEFVNYVLQTPVELPYVNASGGYSHLKCIPPHPAVGDYGPRQSDILVVGKMPNVEELDLVRLHSGIRGAMWQDKLKQLGVDFSTWMYLNVCWWWTDHKNTPAAHFKEWYSVNRLALDIIKPKKILCFGAQALQHITAVTNNKCKVSFKNVRGAILDFEKATKLMVATAPANVLADPTTEHEFIQDLESFSRFIGSTGTPQVGDAKYTILEIDNKADLDALIDRLIAEGHKRFAVDAEWGNGNWLTGKLRTVQIAWSNHEVVVVVLRRQFLVDAFKPDIQSAMSSLERLFYRPGVTIVGHNFRGDAKWFLQYGIDLMPQFINGGLDTMLAHHALYETAEQQLELCALRLLGVGRYDLALRKWLSDNHMTKDEKNDLGYGEVPDDILHPYAGMDSCVTFGLAEVLEPELKKWPRLHEHYIEHVHKTNLPLMEMELTGVYIDKERVREQSKAIADKQQELQSLLQRRFNWPDFNPRSPLHVAEVLFGIGTTKEGVTTHKAPAEALCFHLTPIKTTDATKGIAWEKVQALEPAERLKYRPSTDTESVAILAADCPALKEFRNFKIIDQVKKNFLREEQKDEETGELDWEKGIGSWINEDGRLRTNFRQTLETGRYGTSPNCFSADTEILTKRGWVRFDQLTDTDMCAQYDICTKLIDFVRPINVIRQPHTGMVHITTNTFIDIMCTKDHRCLLLNRRTNEAVAIPAEHYKEDMLQLHAGYYVGGDVSYTQEQITLIAALQADGHIRGDGYGLDFGFSKQRKITRLRNALVTLNIRFEEYYQSTNGPKPRKRFYIRTRDIPAWLADKKFFNSWILDLNRATFKLLAEEVWLWDGCASRRSMFSSKHKYNADWVQILTSLVGRRSKVRLYNTAANTVNWQVDASDTSYSMTTNCSVVETDPTGLAYCVTMPKDTCIVRRNNGCAIITHQCQNLPKATEKDISRCFTTGQYAIRRVNKHGTYEYITTDGWTQHRKFATTFNTELNATQALHTLPADKSCEVIAHLDPRYHSIRSVMQASPGYIFVEPDWNQAELWTMAACAYDNDFLHTLRTSDVHTTMLSKMFASTMYKGKLVSEYTIAELNKLRKIDKALDSWRTAAKAVVFGYTMVYV